MIKPFEVPSKIDGVKVFCPESHSDDRGWLVEAARVDWLKTDHLLMPMAYVSMTKPRTTRGPHKHERQTDWFFFRGDACGMFGVVDVRKESPTHGVCQLFRLGNGTNLSIIVPPGVIHWYTNLSDKDELLVVNVPDALYRGVDYSEPVDEVRYETPSEAIETGAGLR